MAALAMSEIPPSTLTWNRLPSTLGSMACVEIRTSFDPWINSDVRASNRHTCGDSKITFWISSSWVFCHALLICWSFGACKTRSDCCRKKFCRWNAYSEFIFTYARAFFLSIYQSIYLSIYASIQLPIYPSIYPSMYLSSIYTHTVHTHTVHTHTVHAHAVLTLTVHTHTVHTHTVHTLTVHTHTVHTLTVHTHTVHTPTASIYLSIDRSIYPSIHPSIYLSIHPPI